MRPRAFEKALLDLASRSDLELNPATVAHQFNISMAEARAQLDRLVKIGVLEVNSADTGRLYYVLPGREEMAPRAELPWDPRRAVIAAALIWGALAAGALGVAVFADEPQPAAPLTTFVAPRSAAPARVVEHKSRITASPILPLASAPAPAACERPAPETDLMLVTYPFGAAVYEGDRFLGLTPLSVHRGDAEPRSYKVVKPGYQPRVLHVAGEGRHSYEIELHKIAPTAQSVRMRHLNTVR